MTEEFVEAIVSALAEARREAAADMPPQDPTPEMIERGQQVALATGRTLNNAQVHDIWQAMHDEWVAALPLTDEETIPKAEGTSNGQ